MKVGFRSVIDHDEKKGEQEEKGNLPTVKDMNKAIEQSKETSEPVTPDFGGISVNFEGNDDYDEWIKEQKNKEEE